MAFSDRKAMYKDTKKGGVLWVLGWELNQRIMVLLFFRSDHNLVIKLVVRIWHIKQDNHGIRDFYVCCMAPKCIQGYLGGGLIGGERVEIVEIDWRKKGGGVEIMEIRRGYG